MIRYYNDIDLLEIIKAFGAVDLPIIDGSQSLILENENIHEKLLQGHGSVIDGIIKLNRICLHLFRLKRSVRNYYHRRKSAKSVDRKFNDLHGKRHNNSFKLYDLIEILNDTFDMDINKQCYCIYCYDPY